MAKIIPICGAIVKIYTFHHFNPQLYRKNSVGFISLKSINARNSLAIIPPFCFAFPTCTKIVLPFFVAVISGYLYLPEDPTGIRDSFLETFQPRSVSSSFNSFKRYWIWNFNKRRKSSNWLLCPLVWTM